MKIAYFYFQGWWNICRRAWNFDDHCRKSQTIQNPRLVSQQKEGLQGWKILPSCFKCIGHETQRWFGTFEEDQVSSSWKFISLHSIKSRPLLVQSIYGLHAGITVVWDITGVFVSADSILRQPVAEERLSVFQKSVDYSFMCGFLTFVLCLSLLSKILDYVIFWRIISL